LSNHFGVDLYSLSTKFLDLFPSKISSEQTELLSNFDNQEKETDMDITLVDRLFELLRIIENFESIFLSNKQILDIRDLLKEKKINMRNAPAYINNIRMRFNRAQQKLVSILKFSSQNFFKENTVSGDLKSTNLYSNLYYVDYSPSRAQNMAIETENSYGDRMNVSNSPTRLQNYKSKIEKVE
jgi:hypothetical protein